MKPIYHIVLTVLICGLAFLAYQRYNQPSAPAYCEVVPLAQSNQPLLSKDGPPVWDEHLRLYRFTNALTGKYVYFSSIAAAGDLTAEEAAAMTPHQTTPSAQQAPAPQPQPAAPTPTPAVTAPKRK